MVLTEKKRKLSEDSDENDTLSVEKQVQSDMAELFDMGLSKVYGMLLQSLMVIALHHANSGKALEDNESYQNMMKERFGSDSGAAWAGERISKYAAAFGSLEESERYEAMSTKQASMPNFNPLYPSLHKQEAALPPGWSAAADVAARKMANEYKARHGNSREAVEALWRDIKARERDELEENDSDNDVMEDGDEAESNEGKEEGGQHDKA